MAGIIEVMTSQMEKYGQSDPVENVVDEMLDSVVASSLQQIKSSLELGRLMLIAIMIM